MRSRLAYVLIALPLLLGASYQANPAGEPDNSDAVAYRKLQMDGTTDGPCWRQPLLTADPDPAVLQDGDLWCVHSGTGTDKCCFRSGGTSYCINAVALP